MTRDNLEEEHEFHHEWLADALVLLDDGEATIERVCPRCHRAECQCDFEPPESDRQRRRTEYGLETQRKAPTE